MPASGAAALRELERLLADFDTGASARKRHLLAGLGSMRLHSARELSALQRIVCFLRAFPDDAAVHRAARRMANGFAGRIAQLPRAERDSLDDSGTAGSRTRHVYAAAAVQWMARRFAPSVDIDWDAPEAAGAAGAVLAPLFDPLEAESVDLSASGIRAWLAQARGECVSDLAWLLAQAPAAGVARRDFLRAFDAAELPIAWRLDDRAGISGNALPGKVSTRHRGLRRASTDARAAIRQPLPLELLSRRAAVQLLDVWRAALWSRTRSVFQIEQPNLDECYLADFGEGLKMAAVGVRPEHRGALEATYGYLLLANGMPIGYGGFTTLFAQVNTGINVFPEYRGSEAAFAFEQALRAIHAIAGNARFIINPYQFGAGNDEALKSGAYWFYYRLGFRSADGAVRRLAEAEVARMRSDRAYRVPIATLRRLAASDIYLDLSKDAEAKFFDEAWLPCLAGKITATLAREGAARRAVARLQLARRLGAALDIDLSSWSDAERKGFAQFAPLLGQIDDLASWPRDARTALAELCRARWAATERDFVVRAAGHDRLRRALARAAGRA
jgi:hypothetical protein